MGHVRCMSDLLEEMNPNEEWELNVILNAIDDSITKMNGEGVETDVMEGVLLWELEQMRAWIDAILALPEGSLIWEGDIDGVEP